MPEETTDSDPSQELIRHVDVEEETYAPIEKKNVCLQGRWRNATNPSIACCVATGHGHHRASSQSDNSNRCRHQAKAVASCHGHRVMRAAPTGFIFF